MVEYGDSIAILAKMSGTIEYYLSSIARPISLPLC
jgi:hypothetical protein